MFWPFFEDDNVDGRRRHDRDPDYVDSRIWLRCSSTTLDDGQASRNISSKKTKSWHDSSSMRSMPVPTVVNRVKLNYNNKYLRSPCMVDDGDRSLSGDDVNQDELEVDGFSVVHRPEYY